MYTICICGSLAVSINHDNIHTISYHFGTPGYRINYEKWWSEYQIHFAAWSLNIIYPVAIFLPLYLATAQAYGPPPRVRF